MTVDARDVAAESNQDRLRHLVRSAASGEPDAWAALVEEFNSLLITMTRRMRLSAADAADVVQTTWLRLFEHIDALAEPAAVGAWLATTARRESLRVLVLNRRSIPVGEDDLLDGADRTQREPDARLLQAEDAFALQRAMRSLPVHWRSLVDLLLRDPPASYDEISRELALPVGSIGPTRRRCLSRLAELIEG